MNTFKNNTATPKVLIVDDMPDACESTSLILKLYGWQSPATAGTLAQAFDLAADCDVTMLDLGLPDCAREEVVKEFVARFPDMPVIVVTGDDDPETGFQCLRDGAQDFFCKTTMDAKTTKKAIEYAMERHKRQKLQLAIHEANELCSVILEGIGKLRKLLNDAPGANSQSQAVKSGEQA